MTLQELERQLLALTPIEKNSATMATRINEAIFIEKVLARKVIRVNRPSS